MEELSDFDTWMFGLTSGDEVRFVANPDFGQDKLKPRSEVIENELQIDLGELARSYGTPSAMAVADHKVGKADFPTKIHAIRSMVGDDEVVTANSFLYTVCCVLFGNSCAQIKISWEDVQFHKHVFNYAEGYILLPPSKDADFESVTKYAANNGVPFVMDSIKFKDLSPVRKQSAMEMDLPSKFRNLAQRAAWTNPSWITWNAHQFALVLGVEIFDFMRSNIFPYLFKWEGGCGGAPPFNNLFTAGAAIHRFRNGRAKIGILGVMSDSNRLQKGEIGPEQAFFTKNLNLAVSGDKRWLAIRSELERQKLDALHEGIPYNTKIHQEADKTIPPELQAKSAIVNPQDAFTGVALSFLREKGYILTELDLVEREQAEFRLKSVWGPTPMRDIEDQIELRKQEYQESFHEKLTELAVINPERHVLGAVKDIENPLDVQSMAIMKDYYTIRVEEALRFNSFIYNEEIRIFKFEDVESYYNRGTIGIKNSFSESVGAFYRPEMRKQQATPDNAMTYDEIERWLRSDTLDNLMLKPFPPGIGPDDSRVVRDLNMRLENSNDDGHIILLISSDNQLGFTAQRILEHNFRRKQIRIVRLSVNEFLKYCLTEQPREPYQAPGSRRIRDTGWLNEYIYNPLRRRREKIGGVLKEFLEQQAKMIWSARKTRLIIEYDYPNINRSLARFRVLQNEGRLEELSGGYLTRTYVEADWKFPVKEIPNLYQLGEFEQGKRRSVYPISAVRGDRLKFSVPKQFSSNRY